MIGRKDFMGWPIDKTKPASSIIAFDHCSPGAGFAIGAAPPSPADAMTWYGGNAWAIVVWRMPGY
jgi:hypothetical protein